MRGQALTEFLVISLVLISLFLLLPVIGKYQDISHASQYGQPLRCIRCSAAQRRQQQ